MNDFQVSLDKLLIYCDEGLQYLDCPGKVFFEAPESGWLHYVPRLLMLLEGSYDLEYCCEGNILSLNVASPALLFCGTYGLLRTKGHTPGRSLSFSYFPSYIRAMHIDYDGINKPPTSRDVYYHALQPISEAGRTILQLIKQLYDQKHPDLSAAMLPLLFQLTVAELRQTAGDSGRVAGMNVLWSSINTFLREHRSEDLTRDTVARIFRISPGYVSELAKFNTGESFTAIKLRYQLEYAEHLLRHTRLNIDEIAASAGFNSANYFIRRFKKTHGITPHVYRNNQD